MRVWVRWLLVIAEAGGGRYGRDGRYGPKRRKTLADTVARRFGVPSQRRRYSILPALRQSDKGGRNAVKWGAPRALSSCVGNAAGAVAGDEGAVVVGGVDAKRGFVDDADRDSVARFEDAKLFQVFDLFQP